MKKGFTLIELLAVIVILAIILVIAVPQVLNVIENSKKDAFSASALIIAKAIEKDVMLDGTEPATVDCMDDYGLNSTDYASCDATISYSDSSVIVSVTVVGSGKFSGLIAESTSSNSHVVETAGSQSLETTLLASVGLKDISVNKYAGNGLYAWGDKYIYRGGFTRTNSSGLATNEYASDTISGTDVNNYIQVPWEDYSEYTDCTSSSSKCWRIMGINEDGSINIIRDEMLAYDEFDERINTYASIQYSNYEIPFGYNDFLNNSYTQYEDEYREYSDMYVYLHSSSGYENTTIKPYLTMLHPLETCLNKVYYYAGLNKSDYATTGNVKDTCDVAGKNYTTAVSPLQNIYVRLPYMEEYLNASTESTCTEELQYQCRNQNYLYVWDPYFTPNARYGDSWSKYAISNDGSASYGFPASTYGIKPIVALKSTVLISGGTGTQADPYVIKW